MKRRLISLLALVLIISSISIPVNASYSSELAQVANNVVNKTYSDLGLPSSNWCGYFVGYCINNSSVSSLAGEQISRAHSANAMTLINWTCAIKNIGTYYSMSSPHYNRLVNAYRNLSIVSTSVNEYKPAAGDIIVIDWNGRGDESHVFSHVGIVTGYNAGSGTVTFVDGNSGTGNYTYVVRKSVAKTYNPIIGYIRLNGGQVNNTPLPNPTETVKPVTYADCLVEIACFNGQIVNLYNNPGDSSRVTYFSKGQVARSDYSATLSDGSTWYRVIAVHNGEARTFWLKYEPSKMTVTDLIRTHTIHFNANGGSVSISSKQAKAGGTYGDLPNPTRDGYIFDGWYTDINGGKQINFYTTVDLPSDQITLYAHWTSLYTDNSSNTNTGYWGSWSGWSTNYVEAIPHVRMVETRQVKVSDEHTEYRYGRFIDSTGTKVCWCSRYLESWSSVSGSAMLDYSDWSTTQYSPAKPHWTCGFCKGNHINVDHYTSDGRAWWKQYILPGGSYYWEETRTVEAQYETQYSYREWIPG